jgi:hypothetical protein
MHCAMTTGDTASTCTPLAQKGRSMPRCTGTDERGCLWWPCARVHRQEGGHVPCQRTRLQHTACKLTFKHLAMRPDKDNCSAPLRWAGVVHTFWRT